MINLVEAQELEVEVEIILNLLEMMMMIYFLDKIYNTFK